jgi:hypothetical protein
MRHLLVGVAVLTALVIATPVLAQSGAHDTGAPMENKPTISEARSSLSPLLR